MIPQETIKKIIANGVLAPSGDNAQPWRFEIKGDQINTFIVPEKDLSLYNRDQEAALVAHGALLENMRVAAMAAGYTPELRFLPDKNNPLQSGSIFLSKKIQDEDHLLYNAIGKRASNRRPYTSQKIKKEDLEEFTKKAGKWLPLSLLFKTEEKDIHEIAQAVSKNEKILLENQEMHQIFFHHITWTEKEDAINHGFFLKTLEFNSVQKLLFKIFSYWPLLQIGNLLGVATFISKENEKIFKSSAAFGAITAPDRSPLSLLKAGQLLEHVWLLATKNNMAMQITSGITFLAAHATTGKIPLSDLHQKILLKAHNQVKKTFVTEKDIILIFRLGYASPPSSKTTRFGPDIKVYD